MSEIFRKWLAKVSGVWFKRTRYLSTGIDLWIDLEKIFQNQPVQVVFDVGANVGKTVHRFRKHFPEAHIYAFEPVAATFQQLQQNTNALKKLTCERIALSNQEEKQAIRLFEEQLSELNSLNQEVMNQAENASLETVETTTLDVYLTKHILVKIDLLKLDVESWEIPVLEGAKATLQSGKVRAILCEVGFDANNNRFTHLADLMQFLEKYSYAFYGLYDVVPVKGKAHFGSALFVKWEGEAE